MEQYVVISKDNTSYVNVLTLVTLIIIFIMNY